MSDDMFYARVCQERDQLRAELARLQRNEDCVQRLIVWAAENGWNGVDNAKILDSFIIGLFDELRAELMTARETIAAAQEEVAALCAEHNATVAEREALAADNARLRKALELGECYMKVFRHELARNNAMFEGSEDQAEVDGDLAKVQSALAATPSQSLAAHDAAVKVAVLREICKNRSYGGMCRSVAVDYYEWMGKQPPEGELSQRPVTRVAVLDASEVMAEADRIEKEAQRG